MKAIHVTALTHLWMQNGVEAEINLFNEDKSTRRRRTEK